MSHISTAEPRRTAESGQEATAAAQVAPESKKSTPDHRRARDAAAPEEITNSFALQGAIGFLAAGLIALISTAATAVDFLANQEQIVRFLGYGLAGAVGGGALAWGFSRENAPRNAAMGFGFGFLVPAAVCGPTLARLLSLKPEAYGIGTFVGTTMSFTLGFGIAGAIGGAFVLPRLFWAGMVRFGLAAIPGALVIALAPNFSIQGESVTPQIIAGLVAVLIIGNLLPFVLGGAWFGQAIKVEELALRKPRRPRR